MLPKSRVANPARLAPAKSDLAAKTNPEGFWGVLGYSHAVLNPTFSEKCKLYIHTKTQVFGSQTQAGLLRTCAARPLLLRAPPRAKREIAT